MNEEMLLEIMSKMADEQDENVKLIIGLLLKVSKTAINYLNVFVNLATRFVETQETLVKKVQGE